MQLANIIAMFFSSNKVNCVLSALLSVVTEVGGRVYVVYFTRKEFSTSLLLVAKRGHGYMKSATKEDEDVEKRKRFVLNMI